jgi:hypothetical protein
MALRVRIYGTLGSIQSIVCDRKVLIMKFLFRRASLASLAYLSVSSVLLSPLAQAQQSISPNSYPPAVVEDYLKGCQSKAIEAGIPEGIVQNFCSCTLNKLRSRYSVEEFEQLRDLARTNEKMPEAFTEVGMACFGELSSLSFSH